jgi:hypothetical protein
MTFTSQLSAAFTPIAAVYDNASTTRGLTWAQSFVEAYCNQTFDMVTGDVVFLDPRPYRTALLPGVPVANISSVQGLLPPQTSVPNTGYVWKTLTNYNFVSATGFLYDTTGEAGTYSTWLGASGPWLPGSLQVTYDHGYAVVPQPLIDVACRLAQQYLENPTLMMQRRVGDSEQRYAGSKGMTLNQLDEIVLARYTDVGIA